MPYYKGVLDDLTDAGHADQAQDAARRLLSLRHKLSKEVPPRNVMSSVLIATWNLREFGADHKFGKRLDESLLYIAEIVSHFDLVALQEINQNLDNLQRLIRMLGGWWEYLVTDVTLGTSGNSERIAFVYDGRKVRFDHLAGELALPPVKGKAVRQPARSPFICAFKVGWRRLSLCSVHIYYGESKPNDPIRVEEIRAVSQALAARNERRQNVADGEPESVVLLGDFNIFSKAGDKTSAALAENSFVVPDALKKLTARDRTVSGSDVEPPADEDATGTNLERSKHFDQIAFHDPKGQLKASCGGVFDFQAAIYGPREAERYRGAMERSAPDKVKNATSKKELERLYQSWRTFQVSDHLPLWVELKTDFANNYLASVMHGKKRLPATRTATRRLAAASPVETPPPIANAPPGKRRSGKKT
ncbi:MAG TPA: endonuclease/exonuclease/phosphatase family protein [Vicinamibacterales bacterium]|nr:endonuclease/exonuclease/phosphatase family protein [Vicinamibacterales bacterium]